MAGTRKHLILIYVISWSVKLHVNTKYRKRLQYYSKTMFSIGSSEGRLNEVAGRRQLPSSTSLANGLDVTVGVIKFVPESCFCSVIVDGDDCYRSYNKSPTIEMGKNTYCIGNGT